MASELIQTTIIRDTGQLPDIFKRTRTDLNAWLRVPITATNGGTATLNVAALVPGTTVLPCLLLQNNGSVVVGLSFKALTGGTTEAINIPAGDYCYLPQIDYATGIISLTSTINAACLAYLGYAQ